MFFNPDSTKQAKEVIFSKKKKKILGTHPWLFFNNSRIEQDNSKHLSLTLDHKVTF